VIFPENNPSPFVYRFVYPEFDCIEYSAYGGLIVQMLNIQLNTLCKGAYTLMMKQPPKEEASLLVISNVLGESPFKENVQVSPMMETVTHVCGKAVTNIQEYDNALLDYHNSGKSILCIRLRSGRELFSTLDMLNACHSKIVARLTYGVNFINSQPDFTKKYV